MNRLQQAYIWLRRITHCHGFGIQSPTDYHFVRNVVNEHWAYYAYQQLGQDDDWLHRKRGLLYFRMANYLQPKAVADLAGYGEYLKAGCRKTKVFDKITDDTSFIIAGADDAFTIDGNTDVLAIDDISRHSDSWHKVLASQKATVTFDLYYCGIAFFNPQRTKQHYIVNF